MPGVKEKKMEQMRLSELMEDAINGLTNRLMRLRFRLDEEKKKNALLMEAKSINDVEEDDVSPEVLNLEKEIHQTEQQLDYVKGVKVDVDVTLAKLEKDEERKKIERVLKAALLAGIISNNVRTNMEMDMKAEKQAMFQLKLISMVDDLFDNNEFRFVTREMIEDIRNSKEFQRMAEEDPYKLDREEALLRNEYELVMNRALSLGDTDKTSSFEEKEKRFKAFFEKNNGYSQVLRTLDNLEKTILKDYGSEIDIDFFKMIKEEATDLEKETMRLQKEFIDGKSSFKVGNGYTRQFLQKEINILKKVESYRDLMLQKWSAGEQARAQLKGAKAQNPEDVISQEEVDKFAWRFKASLEIVYPLQNQVKRDEIMVRNNELREKMEMWYIYERLPKSGNNSIKKIKQAVINESKAWSKLHRMQRMAVEKGGIYADICSWVMDEAQLLLERCKNPVPIKEPDKKVMRRNLAALVLHQILDEEASFGIDRNAPNIRRLRRSAKGGRGTEFTAMVNELAESREFKKLTEEYLDGKNIGEKCIKFLAEDTEKILATKFIGKEIKGPEPVMRKN